MIDTFSANSLKVLNKSVKEFENKYINSLEFIKKDEKAKLGNKFHGLICYYLKGFNIEKIENSLKEEKETWEKIKNSKIIEFANSGDKKYIEQPFFIKENVCGKNFYLTGRFDAVIKKDEKYIILDWKTKTLPENPKTDIQTIVYFEAASKLFKTENIEMVYYSLSDENIAQVQFEGCYIDEIKKIISKIIQ